MIWDIGNDILPNFVYRDYDNIIGHEIRIPSKTNQDFMVHVTAPGFDHSNGLWCVSYVVFSGNGES